MKVHEPGIKKLLNYYPCEFVNLARAGSDWYLRCVMLERARGRRAGIEALTSKLRSIDFERGIAITQNSIYHWEVT